MQKSVSLKFEPRPAIVITEPNRGAGSQAEQADQDAVRSCQQLVVVIFSPDRANSW